MTEMVSRRSFITQLSGASAAVALGGCAMSPQASTPSTGADLILTRGRITTLDRRRPSASSAAVKDGRFLSVGSDADVMEHPSETTRGIGLRGRVAIPGLTDSHAPLMRGARNQPA